MHFSVAPSVFTRTSTNFSLSGFAESTRNESQRIAPIEKLDKRKGTESRASRTGLPGGRTLTDPADRETPAFHAHATRGPFEVCGLFALWAARIFNSSPDCNSVGFAVSPLAAANQKTLHAGLGEK